MSTASVADASWPQGSVSPNAGDVSRCKYVIKDSQLGDGYFSVVKECMNVYTRDRFAMKLISKKTVEGKLWLIQREVKLLKAVSAKIRELEQSEAACKDTFEGHHHVLQLFDYFETNQNIVLVTQLCSHGDLYEKIIEAGSLDVTRQVKSYTACLLSAINFLHENGVVHRDLKAENVLFRCRVTELSEYSRRGSHYDHHAHDLILADFGLATNLNGNEDELRECVGTISYIAPEVVRCYGISRLAPSEAKAIPAYGAAIDIWALGVLAYFMMTGYMPFDCETDAETKKCISEGDYYVDEELKSDKSLDSKHFWNFVHLCFTINASDRPTSQDLKKHPFVQQFFSTDNQAEPFGDRIALVKSTSSSSLHNLGTPSRSSSSSSLAALGRSESGSNLISIDSRDLKLDRVRETLKKTLSMTSIAPARNNFVDPATQNKKNSTFKLEPMPPSNSLMNGCFSLTPESKSNFTTSPSVSRTHSSTEMGRIMSTGESNGTSLTRQSSGLGNEVTEDECSKAAGTTQRSSRKSGAQFDF